MKRLICFSLWGNDVKYTSGAIENVKLAEIYYPGWTCRYYVSSENTSSDIISALQEYDNCEIVKHSQINSQCQRLIRFLPLRELDVEYFVVRDLDSRLGEREAAAVKEWISSGHEYHIMRDNVEHAVPMMAGMWGAKGNLVPEFLSLVEDHKLKLGESFDTNVQVDQHFLWNYIVPKITSAMVHDESTHLGGNKYPIERSENQIPEFIGQSYENFVL